jgi:SAM-dependent methyltransferase
MRGGRLRGRALRILSQMKQSARPSGGVGEVLGVGTEDRAGTPAPGALRFLRCPGCSRALDAELACAGCGRKVERDGSILDFLGRADLSGKGPMVQAFYEQRPFPGYAPGDDASSLLDRARRSPFLVSLDAALPPDAAVLDCGCGTAQVAAFLALSSARRTIVAADGCRASLRAADGFRERAGLANLQLLRGDLFALPLGEQVFDFVICRGVVHHTADPAGATARVARHVAPGGYLMLGIYETFARALHRARRGLGRVSGGPEGRLVRALDPILRRRDLDPEKKRTWIEDQYLHPLEHSLPLPRVVREVEALGFEFVRSIPPAVEGSDSFFAAGAKPGALAMLARRTGWLLSGLNDQDAGLVCAVMRKR